MKITLLIALILFCGLAVISIGSVAAAPSVSVNPASTIDLPAGGTFSIDVRVDSESYNLRACNIDLTYNSTALSVISVTYAGLIGTSANVLDVSDRTDDGCITSGIARKTLVNPSAPTSGTFITVNFEVKSEASDTAYALDLSTVTLKDENNDAIVGVIVTDGTATVGGGAKTLTWTTEPSASSTTTAAETAAQVATEKPTMKSASAPATSGGGTLPDAPAKKGLPGFEGVFAILGLLAIGYVMMRRKR